MDIITFLLGGLRAVLGFFLLLLIPGFSITLVFFPQLTELRFFERLIYSFILSIGSVIAIVLFIDIFLGVNTTSRNITLFILAFSALSVIIWHCERMYMRSRLKMHLDSMISGDYRILQNYYHRIKDSLESRIRLKKKIIYKKDL